ncbi:HNH endonuclease [Trichocoleus sp. FACHB-591]|uniref:HNH endonuclease n=1 Tax=Trichocoleus sp. FACHB-591 TaxID=2692872 RepID=UPI001682BA2D|nr:HNH endonuclease [Trichocoleus sp. FACHB-591]MBD2094280.1 HNH endonuclease [Trichocoleus sp. FACHB-591]
MTARLFLCNPGKYDGIWLDIKKARTKISMGKKYRTEWTCGQIQKVQVGDVAYFKRTEEKPCGIFARGQVVAAEPNKQLRSLHKRYQHLSPAYGVSETYDYDLDQEYLNEDDLDDSSDQLAYSRKFVVVVEWDSVVDFKEPLNTDVLKKQPRFSGANFDPRGSGRSLNEDVVDLLDSEWEKHLTRLANQNKGVRLSDVFCRAGQQSIEAKLYARAIEEYSQALQINSRLYEPYYRRGLAQLKLKNYDLAIADLTQAILLEPRNPDIYRERAFIYSDAQGNERAAIEDFQKAAEICRQFGWSEQYQELQELIEALKPYPMVEALSANQRDTTKAGESSLPGEVNPSPAQASLEELPKNSTDEVASAENIAVSEIQELEPEIVTIAKLEPVHEAQNQLENDGFFAPRDLETARERITVSIARRQGQSQFRQRLLEAYNYCCAITQCNAREALEAAHILPYSDTVNNHPSNGLLLRADLHTLFDLNLLVIEPETMRVRLAPSLQNTDYRVLDGELIHLPQSRVFYPDRAALQWRCQQCFWYR